MKFSGLHRPASRAKPGYASGSIGGTHEFRKPKIKGDKENRVKVHRKTPENFRVENKPVLHPIDFKPKSKPKPIMPI